ncbi:phage holin family protein [Idiomarina sp. HP20-50]|uniref:phage holin family protein n=1 Tax=Idiomarina sp. HP20-50 TaxID=3070813 RepID=UPI00294ABF0F|nr:phage holin family protein [Idiomarina sp. HP20-50]MDV6314841.1 phage holin family protein [Idiomarina sp. HP20-50]
MTAPNKAEANETEGLLQQIQALESEVRGVVKAQLQLAGMETRRAGESFVRMVALGVIASCLILSAWGALVVAAVAIVVNSAVLSLTTALIVVSACHLGIALYIIKYIKRRSRDLLFSKTSSSF